MPIALPCGANRYSHGCDTAHFVSWRCLAYNTRERSDGAGRAPGDEMANLVGQSLGQYRVLSLVGQGGMARVFQAYQQSLERYVAIKAIAVKVDGKRDEGFVQRFSTEARLVARMTHSNIVPVHDFGEDKGWAFIVMEYISGGTVRDRLAHAETQRTRMDLVLSLDLMAQAALALECAHSNGVIHRDVKPANMLLRNSDHLLLSDFGIAAILEANQAFVRSGGNVGTPQYMAPEQGMPNAVIDGRSDIYALGVVLYQCVTGRLPFLADSPTATVLKHMNEPPPPPSALAPEVPPRVERIILRAMEKHPNARFQRARDLAEELKEAAAELRRARAAVPTVRREEGPAPVAPRAQQAPRGVPGAPGTCFRCGAANPPENRYCTACGYDLSGARGQADRFLAPNGHPLRCRLTVRTGPMTGGVYVLHQDVTTIGRTTDNDVAIVDRSVSRHHAQLVFHQGQWFVEDRGSANGTYVNGVLVRAPLLLTQGCELRLGDDILTFDLVS